MKLSVAFVSLALFGLSACQQTTEVSPAPVAAFEYARRDSTSLQILFTNKSTNSTSYAWDFGDGTQSTDQNPPHSYRNGGIFEVRLRVSNATGQDLVTKTVEVPSLPQADFVYSGGQCTAPCEVSFENRSINTKTYAWDFGDGTQSKEKSPKHTYLKGGNYTIRLTASGSAGTARSEQTISIKDSTDRPVADFVIQNADCIAPCKVKFSNTSKNAEEYLWDFGNGFRSSVPSPEHEFKQAGIFSVQLNAKGKNGTDVSTKTVRIR